MDTTLRCFAPTAWLDATVAAPCGPECDGLHRIRVWDVYARGWVITSTPRDELLASLSESEREMVCQHLGIALD